MSTRMQADVEKIAAELRAGLEAASKGAWQEGAGWVFIDPIDPERNPTRALRNVLRDVPDDELQANVKHIVAAQPENIRALLDELSRLRKALRHIANHTSMLDELENCMEMRRKLEEAMRMSDAHREHAQSSVENGASLNRLLSIAEARAEAAERKLEEHQDAEDKAAREMATVIQGLRNRATAAERKLEEARKALERAAVAAYDEPHYLGPEGMERGADGLLPPGSPYDRGRYDARKAVEVVTSQALESDNG